MDIENSRAVMPVYHRKVICRRNVIGELIAVVCGRGRKCGRMRGKEVGKPMTERLEVAPAPAPLEEYAKHFDGLFGKSNQREGFRRYVEGLLLPSERHKPSDSGCCERMRPPRRRRKGCW